MTVCDPICQCGNAAAQHDTDGDLHIYVEQIATTRLANVHYLHGIETYRELLPPFDTQIYVPYTKLANCHVNYQPYVPKNNYVRQSPVPNKKLMKALDAYRHSIASPDRIGSTKQQPDRRKHD